MTKNKVLVPDHIAAELENEKTAETTTEETKSEVDKAFVSAEDRVLDPTLVDKTLIERMPSPTGWRMLILPYRGRGVSKGGIVLTKESELVDSSFLPSNCDTGIIPANVPVTKASLQSLISSNVKFVSKHSILLSLHTEIALLLVMPFKQYSPTEVKTFSLLIKNRLVELLKS